MTGASRDRGTSANFRYTTSTDMTASVGAALKYELPRNHTAGPRGEGLGIR